MKKTIFITGAGAGIGKATAILFAKNGWNIFATDLNLDGLAELEKTIGSEHSYCKMDVTDVTSINLALDECDKAFTGGIDVLLNNAGIAFIDNFETLPLEKHLAVTNVNVVGVLNMSYLAKPYLDKAKSPVIVNMCSAASNYGVPSEATYSASKFWVRGFTEALNIEWEDQGVHVCDILPNFVATPMMEECGGDIVDNVGIQLTAEDVAKTIWKAAGNRKKVHWHVDTLKFHIGRVITHFLPHSVKRAIMKKVAGF